MKPVNNTKQTRVSTVLSGVTAADVRDTLAMLRTSLERNISGQPSANRRPTDGQQRANRRPTEGQQKANRRPTDGQQTANSNCLYILRRYVCPYSNPQQHIIR